jgi:DcrB
VGRFRATLTAPVPKGWFVRESLELVSPPQNVYAVASVGTVEPETGVEDFAERHRAALSDRLPGYEELGTETVHLAGGPAAILRSFRWTPEEGGALAELHLYAVSGRRGLLARACSPADRFAEVESQLRALLTGIGVGTPSPQGGVLRSESTRRSQTYAAFEAGQLTTTREAAFGLTPSNGEPEPGLAWAETRDSWQKARARL